MQRPGVRDVFDKYVTNSLRFYTKHNPLALRYATASFAQYGEDLALANMFTSERGFYVDIGAYHPFSFSNTYHFYARGWSGINVEPNPHGFGLLEKYRPRDVNVQRIVAANAGQLNFIDDGARSRVDANPQAAVQRIQLSATPLAELLDELGVAQPIDFMSIDCEGSDLDVIRSNDWTRFRPQAMVVEDFQAGTDTPIESELKALDYQLECRLSWSKIFIDTHNPPTGSRQ